jgi:ATP-dependent DNA helicase RecG
MTATPIPRTLAITYNGDMDLSIIDELPKNRPDIFTSQIEKNNLETAYDFITEKAKNNEQSIIVYPLIEETETQDLEAALQSYIKLKDTIFKEYKVGLIHGKLDSDEKNEIMNQFISNEIQILISTTVIEVGIDNPNASVILINNCERFGLSQIHQLRGRVGRGSLTSYCILCSDTESENTKQRLSILCKTRNGFEIADEDLKLRGPGEFFGERQSGFIKFRIADLVTDGNIIRFARKKAFEIVDKDENLENSENRLIHDRFNSDYLKLFLNTTVN